MVRARIAAADAVAAFEQARREQLDVLAKTRASYFRLVNAHAQLELNRKNLVSLRQIAEVSRSRYEVGKANAAEPLAGEVEASKLLESEQDILRNISAEQSQLNVLMNRDAFAPLGQPEETKINSLNLSMEQARALALANRPEIKIAQAKIDMEKSRLELSRRNWIPDPAVTVQAQRYNDSRQAASEVDAGVSFTVPWVNPGKYSAAVREAKENLAAAQHAFERTNAESLGLAARRAAKSPHGKTSCRSFPGQTRPASASGVRSQPVLLRNRQGQFPRMDHRATKPARSRSDGATAHRGLLRGAGRTRSCRRRRPQSFSLNQNKGTKMKSITLKLFVLAVLIISPACSKSNKSAKPPDVDYYTCTMHPSVHAEAPGKCPICGMDLVPVMKKNSDATSPAQTSPSGGTASGHEFVVPVERQQQIGVTLRNGETRAAAPHHSRGRRCRNGFTTPLGFRRARGRIRERIVRSVRRTTRREETRR